MIKNIVKIVIYLIPFKKGDMMSELIKDTNRATNDAHKF